jgi:ATP-binding protein involved in chromosome partitioning
VCIGAIIISTPQDLSLKDAVKGVELFRKVSVPLLGLVSNMSSFICPNCSTAHPIFGPQTHIKEMCEKYELRLLGEVPLDPRICEDADRGKPTVVAEQGGPRAEAFGRIAETVEGLVGLEKRKEG